MFTRGLGWGCFPIIFVGAYQRPERDRSHHCAEISYSSPVAMPPWLRVRDFYWGCRLGLFENRVNNRVLGWFFLRVLLLINPRVTGATTAPNLETRACSHLSG